MARRGISVQFQGLSAMNRTGRNFPMKNGVKKKSTAEGESQASGKNSGIKKRTGVISRNTSHSDWGILYPALAREMGKEGRVTIRCIILSNTSRCNKAVILKSSGYSELDMTAQKGIMRYDKFVPMPYNRNLSLNVNFKLVD